MAFDMQSQLAELGDISLAVLVSLVSEQHCIFSTEAESDNSRLVHELRLACIDTFGLQPSIVECAAELTGDQFNEAVLVDANEDTQDEILDSPEEGIDGMTFSVDLHPSRARGLQHSQGFSLSQRSNLKNTLDERRVADVVIAVNLDLACINVQVQALELIRSKRIFTRSSMHIAPKDLLLIAVLSRPEARLSHHLNDLFGLSHVHEDADGLLHLDESMEIYPTPPFDSAVIRQLKDLTGKVRFTAEMAQYLHNIAVFMRTSRYVKGGATATATRQLHVICRALAPLHGLDYVPPSLVALAARKVYPHRLVLATPENEKSLQWGSDPDAVRELLDGMTIADVIETVLASIETPL